MNLSSQDQQAIEDFIFFTSHSQVLAMSAETFPELGLSDEALDALVFGGGQPGVKAAIAKKVKSYKARYGEIKILAPTGLVSPAKMPILPRLPCTVAVPTPRRLVPPAVNSDEIARADDGIQCIWVDEDGIPIPVSSIPEANRNSRDSLIFRRLADEKTRLDLLRDVTLDENCVLARLARLKWVGCRALDHGSSDLDSAIAIEIFRCTYSCRLFEAVRISRHLFPNAFVEHPGLRGYPYLLSGVLTTKCPSDFSGVFWPKICWGDVRSFDTSCLYASRSTVLRRIRPFYRGESCLVFLDGHPLSSHSRGHPAV
jgi:hypothetical protein